MHYPPYPNTSQAGPPLFPGRRSMPRWVVALLVVMATVVVLVPIVLVVGFFYADGKIHENLRFPEEDVTVISCGRDEVTGRPVAGIRVTSEAARSGTYTVRVVFRDLRARGGRGVDAGEGSVVVPDLAAGATVSEQVTGPVPVWGAAECELGDVTFESTRKAANEAAHGP